MSSSLGFQCRKKGSVALQCIFIREKLSPPPGAMSRGCWEARGWRRGHSPVPDHAHGQHPLPLLWCHVGAEGPGPMRQGCSPVLDHAHGHPVCRVHVLPNEVLEHDERLHQEVLQQQSKTPAILLYRKWLEGPRSCELFKLFLFSFLEVQKGKGHSLSLCKPNETNRGGFSNEILQLITGRLFHRYKWNMNMECENPLKIKHC